MNLYRSQEAHARWMRRQAMQFAAAYAEELGWEPPITIHMQAIVRELAGIVCDLGDVAELNEHLQAVQRDELAAPLAEAFLKADRYDLTDL